MRLDRIKSLTIILGTLLVLQGNFFEIDAQKKSTGKKTAKASSGVISTVYSSPDGKEWVHKGKKGIFVTKDSLGVVRAMQDYSGSPAAAKKYAGIVSEYARQLEGDEVTVYSLIAPTQGEFYLPEPFSTQGAEQAAIETIYSYMDPLVVTVSVSDTLRAHKGEHIFSYTDHHWAPLGAYYAAKVFAEDAGVDFTPLSEFTQGEVKDYVGTMYSFSGDPAVKNNPETFVYYMPPEGYEAEFITYKLSNGKTVGESAPAKRDFFRSFPDGSGAAYCTFMGGDALTVKVTETGGTPGRKVLVVKDSFGNALIPALFGSFEEVHVTDFRYFPHGLLDYVRKNDITDLLFLNSIQLAPAPNTAKRLEVMLK